MAGNKNPRLVFDLPGTVEDVFVGAEFVQAHRPAGVEAVGGDADFGTEAELEAVGKAGAGVVEDGRGIDSGEELSGDFSVFGDDGIGVSGATAVDYADGSDCVGHDGNGEDEVVVLGGKVFVCGFDQRQAAAVEQGFSSDIDAQFDTGIVQRLGQAGKLVSGLLVDQEVFCGVADAGALGLGVN